MARVCGPPVSSMCRRLLVARTSRAMTTLTAQRGGDDDVCGHELLGGADGGGRRLDAGGAVLLAVGQPVDGGCRGEQGELRGELEIDPGLSAVRPGVRGRAGDGLG